MSKPQERRNQLFICYRRDDTAWVVGRIYDRLIQKFDKEAIFKDVDSIPLGVNFKQYIDSVIKQCAVVLVVIGDNWMGETKETGKRNIDDPRDYVRIEIESALARDIPIIPLLVQNASIPPEEELPPTLKDFSYRHGMSIGNDPYFHTDIDRLIKSLEFYLASIPRIEDQQLTGDKFNDEVHQIDRVKKGESVHNYLEILYALPNRLRAYTISLLHALSVRRRVEDGKRTQPGQSKGEIYSNIFQSVIILSALWIGIFAFVIFEVNWDPAKAQGLTYLGLLFFLFLTFSLSGAIFGFLWPDGRWMWGIALTIIPSLFYVSASLLLLAVAISERSSYGLFTIPFINFLVLSSSACIGSYIGARYSVRKK